MKICKTEQEYIEAIAPAVQRACKRYGYLPSVLIGQSCLENGFGIRNYWDNPQIEALLSVNNMVGIKSSLLTDSWAEYSVWPGESITKKTPEEYGGKMVTITDSFRKYDSIEQSFCDFLLFLKYASNYGRGGKPKYGPEVLSIKDPFELIKVVNAKGYASGSTYATNVSKIIRKHDLTKYDDLTLVKPTDIVPDILKNKREEKPTSTKKLADRKVIDITRENQAPRSRGGNPIQFIVVHYLGVPNADNPYLYDGGYGGHYNITRKGEVYKAADPRKYVVWQCGGGLQGNSGHQYHGICTNYNSIGIECGVCYTENVKDASGDSDKWYFTEETQESLVWLVSKLMDEYNIPIGNVIRHYDVTGKTCPNPYVLNHGKNGNWTWNEFKANLAQYRKDGTITIPDRSKNPASPTTTPATKSYLSKGDKGAAVIDMQSMLIACGYSCGSAGADGDFGNATDKALRAFQTDQKLTVDGKYGKASKAALEALYKAKGGKKEDVIVTSDYKIGTLDYSSIFDPTYYVNKYPDLKKAFGNDKTKLWSHFVLWGRKEGRQASNNFNPVNYRSRYSDLNTAFGDDWPSYYQHWLVYGKKEGRNGK